MMTEKGDRIAFVSAAINFKSEEGLVWPYCRRGNYGAFAVKDRSTYAHVIVCERVHGEKPSPNHQVAHSCNVCLCVNPAHLRWATPKENCADREGHSDKNRGARHNMAKLNEMQVLEILGSEDKGVRLAEKYEVSTTTISLIRSHKNWKYLHEELPNVTKT